MAQIYYKDANVIIFVYDLTSKRSFESIKNWENEIKETINENIIKVLVGNKIDLLSEEEKNFDLAKDFAKEAKCEFFLASAKSGEGINDIFEKILIKISEIQKSSTNNKIRNTYDDRLILTRKKTSNIKFDDFSQKNCCFKY